MCALSLTERMIEFVWHSKRQKIIQATVHCREKEDNFENQLREYEVLASVEDRGVLVEVMTRFDLSHNSLKKPHEGWAPVNVLTLEILSVRELKGVQAHFDINSTWDDDNLRILCDVSYEKEIREIWAGLGLETNAVVRTPLTERKTA